MITESAAPPQWTVRRSGRASRIGSTSLLVLGLALFAVPQVFAANIVQQLTSLLIFLILAVMWNALAGYGGMVSVGQQAYIGFGAYGTIFLTLLYYDYRVRREGFDVRLLSLATPETALDKGAES